MNRLFPIQHTDRPIARSSREVFSTSPDALAQTGGGHAYGSGVSSSVWMWSVGCVSIVFLVLFSRLFFLQIDRGGSFRQLAEENRTRSVTILARRGIVTDVYGKPLIGNAPAFALLVTSVELPIDRTERTRVIEDVAEIAGIQPTDIDLAIADAGDASEAIPIPVPLEYIRAMKLLVDADLYPGVSVEHTTIRQYPTTPLQTLSHVLGYTGFISKEEYDVRMSDGYRRIDRLGKQGIEAAYETELRGKNGARILEVNAVGNEARLIREEAPTDGENLTLTLDVDLDQFIEERLASVLTSSRTARASVVVLDPRDGSVRALVSVPGYDNNMFAKGVGTTAYQTLLENPNHPLFPRAIAGEFPPGSTFKPTVASIALDDGLIDEQTSFISMGGISVGPWFFPDWKASGHGITNVRKALAESVNTFFYAIGGGLGDFRGLGIERITARARDFGFGQTTGIDLPGEATGFLPSKEWKETTKGERWYVGDTYHAAIGQGDVLVTPLQLAVATATIANGGTRYAPHLLQREKNIPLGTMVAKPEALKIVREGMRDAVVYGSARSLANLPIAVAGKTGTAQNSGGGAPHAWFTSFGPYEDPQLVVTVLIEEGGDGSAVAAPLARDIYAWLTANRLTQ